MTVELFGEAPPNSLTFVLAHLLPLADSPDHLGIERREGGPLPFFWVHLLDEVEFLTERKVEALISLHTLAEAVDGLDADTVAIREGGRAHQRMLVLADNPLTDVPMPDGTLANCEYLRTLERPVLRDYGSDTISRTKAVYRIGLSFVAL
jgi:hypothetical protein